MSMIDAGVASTSGGDHCVEVVQLDGIWALASGTGPGAVWSARSARQALLDRVGQLQTAIAQDDGPSAATTLRQIFETAAERAHRAAHETGEPRAGHLAIVLGVANRILLAHAGDGAALLASDLGVRRLAPDPSLDGPAAALRRMRRQPLGSLPTCVPDLLNLDFQDAQSLLVGSPGVLDAAPPPLDPLADPAQTARDLLERARRRGEAGELAALVLRDQAAPALLETTLDRGLEVSALFQDLDRETRHRLSPYLLERELAEGQQLFAEGDRGQRLYLVLRGELVVSRGGRELTRLGAGRHLGEIALVLDGRRTATVVSTQPTRVASLHRRHLQELLDTRPELGIHLMQGICRELATRVSSLSEDVAGG
jgi:hypothetical protein